MSDKKQKIKDISVSVDVSILAALKKMDETYKRLLLVFKDNQFVNVLSIGDIQRAIIRNQSFDTQIEEILRKDTRVAHISNTYDEIKSQMLKYKAECMPVVDYDNRLVDVLFWEDVFKAIDKPVSAKLNLPVVIMAGGKGSRLKPLTNVIPKPLLPIGNKTIIEEIMNHFLKAGCHQFYISVNYKAETIKHYFSELKSDDYLIDYFQEERPLGTAGSLYLIKDKIETTFFVSNCDIIIDEDYSEILKYHKENQNELTIVSIVKHYPIPYGTIKTQKGGILSKLVEKPNLTFQINSGFYILESHLINEIPENKFLHITTLIENIQKRNGRVGVFPVSEGSWVDIGTWDEYIYRISQKGIIKTIN